MSANARQVLTPDTVEEPAALPSDAHGAPAMPAADRERFDRMALVVWTAFRLAAWSSFLVMLAPRVLDYVGGNDIARWLERHTWVRVLSVPILGPFWLLSAFELRNSSRARAARSSVAEAIGATVVRAPRLDSTYGLPDGPALRVPLGAWSMTIATWVRKGSRRTVARVALESRTRFSLVARSAGREPAMLRGLQQGLMAHAIGEAASRASDLQAAAMSATLAYLGEAPMTLGDPSMDRLLVARANQPETARCLLTAAAVAAALAAMEGKCQSWDWTLYPGVKPGSAEMSFEYQGGMLDAEHVQLVKALLGAALEHLAGAGVIEQRDQAGG